MLGSSKESSNMQSLNFTTPCNRLALLVNPKRQQPIKYFPVFTWNRVGNRTSAEASNSRQLVWLNVVQEQEGGGSVRGGAGRIVLVFPKPGEMRHCRSSSQAQGYLSPFLLWSTSSRQTASLRRLPQPTQSRSTTWASRHLSGEEQKS